MQMITFLLSVVLLLLPSHPTRVLDAASINECKRDEEVYDNGDHVDKFLRDKGEGENDGEVYHGDYDHQYEFKMELALSHYADTRAQDLLERTLLVGEITPDMEFCSNGNLVANSNIRDQVEIALELLEHQVHVLYDVHFGTEDEVYDGNIEEDELLKNDPELKTILYAIEDETLQNELYDDIEYEADLKDELDPDLWHKCKYWELHAYFSCERIFAESRPMYDTEKWNTLHQFYHEFTSEDKDDRSYDDDNPERTYQFSTESFDPPIEPFQAGGTKGRGIRAARDISQGELVFQATNNTVIFTHGHTWRKFLFAIDEKYGSGTTCDVLAWSWVQALEEGGPAVIVADFDNGSLLNEGREEEGRWELPNVRCGKDGDTICMMEYYSTKDVKEGDELLCDYRGFAMLDGWADLGA